MNAQLRAILSALPDTEVASARLAPSSVRRCANIKMLIGELASRDMRAEDAAVMLQASASCARNYMNELCAAGVIAATFQLDSTPKIRRPYYRLSADLERVRAFAAGLAPLGREVPPPAKRVNGAPARRDPLVAALFGSPRR